MSKPLPIFTIQTFSQTALQPAGAIFAQRVESISMGRNFFAGVAGAVGGRSTLMEKKMNDLTKSLMEELDIQAKRQYPNAVALVDVSVNFSEMGKNDSNMFLAGQASATALIKRVKPAGQSMVPASVQPSLPPALPPMPSLAPAPSLQQEQPLPKLNSKNLMIPKPISGGKSIKKKSFITKSRKNRYHE